MNGLMLGTLCVLVPGVITAAVFAIRETGRNHRRQGGHE